jgi:hypothetical protein
MAFASLTIDLNARLANIERDLNRSVNMAESSAKKMQSAFNKVGAAFGLLGIAGVGGNIFGNLKGLIDSADGLNDLATRTGSSVKALASLQLAAKLADTDLENLGAGLGKLSLYMANNAEEAAALGITARDPVEAFIQLADVVGSVNDPAERNALAMKVMGKSYAELMPLLAQGGAALGQQAKDSAIYADRMVKLSASAGQFNDAIDMLAQNGKTALLPLIQSLTDIANAAVEASAAFEGMDSALAGIGSFGTFGETLAVTGANILFVFRVLANDVLSSLTAINYAMTAQFGMAKQTLDQAAAYAQAERAKLDKLERGILSKQSTPKKPPDTTPKAGANIDVKDFLGGPDSPEKLQSTLRKAFDITPLDDFVAGFKNQRQSIEKEYEQLISKLTGPSIANATGGDLSYEITKGKGALEQGDSTGTEIAIDRSRQMLEGLKDNGGADFEISYYANQLKQLELAMVDSQQATAETTRSAMLEQLNAAAAEVSKMDPLHIPIAAEAIAQDLRATLDVVRQELANNPLKVPIVATSSSGIYGDSSLTTAARKLGGSK